MRPVLLNMKYRRKYNCTLLPIRTGSVCGLTTCYYYCSIIVHRQHWKMEGQKFLNDAGHILANSSHFKAENNCIIWRGACVKKGNELYYGIAYVKPPEKHKRRHTMYTD